jgi:hypothetical protein
VDGNPASVRAIAELKQSGGRAMLLPAVTVFEQYY